jgi:TonB family protein
MRGRTVAVTFWVATDGRVERVALDPEPEDRGFGRKLSDVMRNYRFRPARSADGQVIAGTTTVSVTF